MSHTHTIWRYMMPLADTLAHHSPGGTPMDEIKPSPTHPRVITIEEKYRSTLNDAVALGDLVGAIAAELGISYKAETGTFIAAIRARGATPDVEQHATVLALHRQVAEREAAIERVRRRTDLIHTASREWDVSARPGGLLRCCEVRDLLDGYEEQA